MSCTRRASESRGYRARSTLVELAVVLIAALAAILLGNPPLVAAAAVTPLSQVHGYAYDMPQSAGGRTYTATERGPPTTYDHGTALAAGDLASHGPSVRPDAPDPVVTSPTTPTLGSVGAGSVGATAREPHGTLNGALSSRQQWRVAAKAETSVLTRIKNWSGREYKFGPNLRIAPFGNRTGHPTGRYPHYHRRVVDDAGETLPGQGIGRHRPWDTKSPDTSFWDRF